MKLKITETVTREVDIKHLCLDANVRYWEDADINGKEDISYNEQAKGKKPRVPLAIENPDARYLDDKYHWVIKIDTNTGNIVGWPEGVTANIHYKVCDEGIYWLEDAEGNEIHKIESYVPELFDFCNDSYGDYIIMTVDENGHIEEWYEYDELQDRVQSFLDEEGF